MAAKDLAVGSLVNWRSLNWIVEEISKTHLELLPHDPIQQKAIGRVKIARALTPESSIEVIENNQALIFPSDDERASWDPTTLRLAILPFLRFPSWAKKDRLLWSTAVKIQEIDRQLVPLHFALEQKHPRLMIADDVGLGKTTEAAVIINEFLARSMAKRVLIVCPAQLINKKWMPELNQRFGLSFSAIDGDNLANVYGSMQLNANENPFTLLDRVVVSLDWAKQPFIRSRLKESPWDLVIIDECHRVADRSDAPSGVAMRARLARELAQSTKGLVIMSATPHDGNPASFQSLIDLLKTENPLLPKPAKPIVIRRLRRDLSHASAALAPEPKFMRFHPHKNWENIANEIDKLVEAISTEDKQSPRELLRIVLLKRFMSSPQALSDTLNLKGVDDREDDISDDGMVSSFLETPAGAKNKEKISKLIKELEEQDSKFETLLNYLKTDVPKNDNFIIFTEFESTARYLAKRFNELSRFDRKVLVATGADREELELSLRKFKAQNKTILIATDALSEGVDLQHNCHRLLHYDLPFRPYRLEQRNGRIDRMGQEHKPIIHLLTPYEDSLVKWTKSKDSKSAQSVLSDTLSIVRLYGFLVQQANALNNSLVPVLEALAINEQSEMDLISKVTSTLKKADTLSPDQYDVSLTSKFKGKDYDFADNASIKSLSWATQKEVDLDVDLLSRVKSKLFNILQTYWVESGTAEVSIETNSAATKIVGSAGAEIWGRIRPEQKRSDKKISLALKTKEDCVYTESTEVFSWAHAIWDELEQATYWQTKSRESVNVVLSNIQSQKPQVLFIVRSKAGLNLYLFEKQTNWITQPADAAILVLSEELHELGRTNITRAAPRRAHRDWVTDRYEKLNSNLKHDDKILGVIVRDEN
ncbi:MAG: DEAD/DEAH box helicase family protein [Deltaproteobacteria bacterium]|nr:DEAD/DEAH box helicase family protein [Deltaproteobacteria bacterium]